MYVLKMGYMFMAEDKRDNKLFPTSSVWLAKRFASEAHAEQGAFDHSNTKALTIAKVSVTEELVKKF